ncbi:TetR family transcriptional regulator [Pseudomonas syringae]|nr:TetR family transcriptional regulator [Pseudomonas syringae]POD16891.1 TetR family transcriptional regulator [Pseudomonas syringae pv. syringae]MCF5205931.1 TetR family transcriptional regulator [Pseudomonas syringae]MCF5273309.1 TetR family transcriptional regulator [Pseudomonas syringae]MCF5275043.1 TetR family transcriptional regulator [Pseudomonas syringae]
MSTSNRNQADPTRRQRMIREDRLRQLLDVAWRLVGERGSDALTLGRLAEQAGVTKPVVYDHFATRAALFAALYEDFDQRQTARMDIAIAASEATLDGVANVVASSYVDCVLLQGHEIAGVIAVLSSTPELEKIKREYEAKFLIKCRTWFSPFLKAGELGLSSLHAIVGCAESLSAAAAREEISSEDAKKELMAVIVAVVQKAGRGGLEK